MAGQLNAETKILRRRQCGADRDKWAVELLVRQIPPEPLSIQHRVAVLGNVDAGKSTLGMGSILKIPDINNLKKFIC